MADKQEVETVELYYCYKCKMIVFSIIESVARYGKSRQTVESDGYYYEDEFDAKDGDTFDTFCNDCGDDLHARITLHKELFEKIHEKHGEFSGFEVTLEKVEELSLDEVKDAVFEALI